MKSRHLSHPAHLGYMLSIQLFPPDYGVLRVLPGQDRLHRCYAFSMDVVPEERASNIEAIQESRVPPRGRVRLSGMAWHGMAWHGMAGQGVAGGTMGRG